MDALGSWLDENCDVDENAKELISAVYSDYKRWADDSEEYLLSKKEFVRKMVDRGFKKTQTTDRKTGAKGRFLMGVRLKHQSKFTLTP